MTESVLLWLIMKKKKKAGVFVCFPNSLGAVHTFIKISAYLWMQLGSMSVCFMS